MLYQRLLLEEFGVDLRFIQGIKNEVADMLSRNEFVDEPEKIVSTIVFEFMILNTRINDILVSVDYEKQLHINGTIKI